MKFKQFEFRQSPNYTAAQNSAELIVIHYTAGHDSLPWLTNPESKASAHFLIGRDGKTTQLVDTDHIAWHAGRSEYWGRKSVNRFSIGIELENLGNLKGDFEPFQNTQMGSLLTLIADLLEAHESIKDIVGHCDVAPNRKIDPGPLFPWFYFEKLRSHVDGLKIRGK
jgi:N-acetylmuramoyl-L-alanine amidase